MTQSNNERGEQRRDPRPERQPEAQENARPNNARSPDDRGRDSNRPGSESGGGD